MAKNIKIVQQVSAFTKVEGVHRWDNCHIKEVEYLKNDHRHVFHIRAWKDVNHDDRDVEFIELSHKINRYLKEKYWSVQHQALYFQSMSCEMIAKELIEQFSLAKCEVLEDGEGGAIVEYVQSIIFNTK